MCAATEHHKHSMDRRENLIEVCNLHTKLSCKIYAITIYISGMFVYAFNFRLTFPNGIIVLSHTRLESQLHPINWSKDKNNHSLHHHDQHYLPSHCFSSHNICISFGYSHILYMHYAPMGGQQIYTFAH